MNVRIILSLHKSILRKTKQKQINLKKNKSCKIITKKKEEKIINKIIIKIGQKSLNQLN